MGDGGGGHWLVWMEWRPAGWSVSASVNVPWHHKVQKFSSGTSSPRWSRKKGCKMVVCVCLCVCRWLSQSNAGQNWKSSDLIQDMQPSSIQICGLGSGQLIGYLSIISHIVPTNRHSSINHFYSVNHYYYFYYYYYICLMAFFQGQPG